MSEPTIFIVDDDEAVRDSLEFLLSASGYTTEGWSSPVEFLDRASARPLGPGCLLLDVRMPEMDGLTLLGRLRDYGVALPVVIMTGHGDVPLAVRAMKAGASDFVEKPFSQETITSAVSAALKRPAADNAGARAAKACLQRLTQREQEVMKLLINGLSNKEVAIDLGISPRTVEIHRARVMEKTGTRSLPELVRLGITAGLEAGS